MDCLRASDAHVPELSLVAEAGGVVVGHVLVTHVRLAAESAEPGEQRRVLSLAPLAVRPEHQARGIGSALVRAALGIAERREEPLVVLLGHPTYYPRFGFEPARRLGVAPPFAVPDGVWMLHRLPAYTPAVHGRVIYPPCFDGL